MNVIKHGVNAESHGANASKEFKKRIFEISFRWILIACVGIHFYFLYKNNNIRPVGIIVIFILTLICNIAYSYHTLKASEKSKTLKKYIVYFDAIALSMLCAQAGGIDPELYVIYFFIIGLCSLLGDMVETIKTGGLIVLLYSFIYIYSMKESPGGPVYWILVLRDIYLLLATFGIMFVNSEVRKYGEMHKKEFRLARTDKLTGLANRHYFDQKLNEEVDYADFSGMPLNMLIFDLDNFKKFNDTYGHVWGDKLLVLFSDIIKQNIRRSDIPVRYGGEEFLILIRDLDIHTAKSVGERIRRQLEKQRIYVGNGDNRTRVTVSCGVAQYPRDSKNIKQVLEYADKALYNAKESGKNMAVIYSDIDSLKQGVQLDIDSFIDK